MSDFWPLGVIIVIGLLFAAGVAYFLDYQPKVRTCERTAFELNVEYDFNYWRSDGSECMIAIGPEGALIPLDRYRVED